MELKKKIEELFLKSLRGKQEFVLSTVRMLKAALTNKEIELKKELTDEDILSVVSTEIKKRKDASSTYLSGGRPELADKENKEIEILSEFMPSQLSSDEVKAKIQAIISALPEDKKTNFGAVMGLVMKELKGQADGGVINSLVKELLGQ